MIVKILRNKERICAALVMLTLVLCVSYPFTQCAITAPVASEIIGGLTAHALGVQVTITETPVTTDPKLQAYPAIYGNIIVWEDFRESDAHIYMYDLSTGIETRVPSSFTIQYKPEIYGDIIIWNDMREEGMRIFMYDLLTGSEAKVSQNEGPSHAMAPNIYGDIIVWYDSRNWESGHYDIYMCNLSTGEETPVCTDPADQVCPAVYGDIIVWMDYRNGNSDIYMYNLLTGEETPVCTNPAYQSFPEVYGNVIVWEDNRDGNVDIYMYDLSTETETPVTTQSVDQYDPSIWGDTIVWTDRRNAVMNYNYDIYMYDLSTGIETQVTTNPASQADPAVYGDIVVWIDNRNGNIDIYMAEISFVPEPIPPAEQAENIASIVAEIPGIDFAGATEGVRENRKQALLNMLQVVIMDIQTAEASSELLTVASDPSTIGMAYQSAIDQLNSILGKTDGCAERGTPDTIGSGYTPDWITTCESQALIDPHIRELIATLEALLIT